MKRRHVAIFTNLGNGHIYPTLGLCSELVSRGYRVTYATNEYYAKRIRQTGAEAVLFSPAGFEESEQFKRLRDLPVSDPQWWPLYASVVYPWFLTDATVTLPQVDGFYSENIPDVILYDQLAFAGRIMGARLNVPTVKLGFNFAPYRNYLLRQRGFFLMPEPMIAFSKRLDSFLSSHGVKGEDGLSHIEQLNIYFIPKEFQIYGDAFDSRFQFVGPCLNRPFLRTWENNSGGKPILLISGLSDGVDVNYFKVFVDALAGLDYHVILSVGKHIPVSAFGTIPKNFVINKLTEHLEILPHAALTICQAGMGTVAESIYHGVPVIGIPTAGCFVEEIAHRVEELGLGLHLPPTAMTSDTIGDAVKTVLGDRSLLDRVKTMQGVFRNAGGAGMAINSIESLLGA